MTAPTDLQHEAAAPEPAAAAPPDFTLGRMIRFASIVSAILLAAGSELQFALAAAAELGAGTRVVSVPSFERFDRQSIEYRESILPKACRRRVSIEAGVTGLLKSYVGLDGATVGIDRFGLSGPGAEVYQELGITAKAVVEAVRRLG